MFLHLFSWCDVKRHVTQHLFVVVSVAEGDVTEADGTSVGPAIVGLVVGQRLERSLLVQLLVLEHALRRRHLNTSTQ